jgi:hypothetical protein
MTSAEELKQRLVDTPASEEEAKAALERLQRQNTKVEEVRCNSRCMTATSEESKCQCSCGGELHGVGAQESEPDSQQRKLKSGDSQPKEVRQ